MRRLSPLDRLLPVGYFATAVAVAMLVLPSSLRPLPQAPPTSAQLDANAPPDDTEVVLSELGQGRSGTVTGGLTGPGEEPAAAASEVAKIVVAPRKGKCFGNPPRQTESLYSAACAPAFVGDNGGATTKGVTAHEINIGVAWGSGRYSGPLRDPYPGDSEFERRMRVWQAYFNERYELYGRRLRLIMVSAPYARTPAEDKSAVAGADAQWPLFGFFRAVLSYPAYEEAARRKIVTFDEVAMNPHTWYEKHHPYAYSWLLDQHKAWAMTGELLCKQFAGKPPWFNQRRDPTFDYTAPRKFGLIDYEETGGIRSGAVETSTRELAKCGQRFEQIVQYNLYDNQEGLAAAMTKMRAAGVTTILVWNDGLGTIALTHEASNSGYYPEWWQVSDYYTPNGTAQLYTQDQWRHAIVGWATEIPRLPGHDDCSVAFRAQAPDDSPGECTTYRTLQQFANGIQGAGPKLTPETFFVGLKKTPCRTPVPNWSIGGCYRDGDLTYPDYRALAWWDPAARAPDDTDPGAWRFMYDGKRFTFGEFPTESPWFKEGITTPTDPVQHE